MKMYCLRCKGAVWLEVEYPLWRYYDLTCLKCGRRKVLDTHNDTLGKRLREMVLNDIGVTYFWVERPHVGKRTLLARRGKDWKVVGERKTNIHNEQEAVSP